MDRQPVGWHTDPAGRSWLVLDGVPTRYYTVSGVDVGGYYWAPYDDRDRARPWPALGRFVIKVPTRHDLERWIAASDLP